VEIEKRGVVVGINDLEAFAFSRKRPEAAGGRPDGRIRLAERCGRIWKDVVGRLEDLGAGAPGQPQGKKNEQDDAQGRE